MDRGYGIFRYIAYSIEIILMFILQTTPNLIPEIFGAKPLLLIPVALTIAFFEEEIPAMFFGLSCGIILDLSSSDNIGFFAFTLTLISFIMSQIFRDYMVVSLLNSLAFVSATSLVFIFLHFMIFYLFAGKIDPLYYFVNHNLPKIIYTIVITPIIYGINRFLYRNLRD